MADQLLGQDGLQPLDESSARYRSAPSLVVGGVTFRD